jgi:predicted nucleic acid-binding protein
VKVFWDTNLFIYLWEGSPHSARVEKLARSMDACDGQICTSSLTIAEILAHPMRAGGRREAADYLNRFAGLEIVGFGTKEAVVFAEIRARYAAVSPPDAIQLACASTSGSSIFVTNDARLGELAIPGLEETLSLERALQELGT